MRPLEKLRSLWELAKREQAAPHQIGLAVGVGVFAGCTPALWFHMWVALLLATLFRVNRLWAFLGSRISFFPVFGLITFAEIQVAHRIRTGQWLDMEVSGALSHAKELLVDWLLGAALVGVVLGGIVGYAAYAVARWRASRSTADPPRLAS